MPSRAERLHRKSGMVFVYAMLVMSLSGAVMAVGRPGAAINIPAGLVTAYLVITALAHGPAAVRGIASGWSAARCWRRSRSVWRSVVAASVERRQGQRRYGVSAPDVRRRRTARPAWAIAG